MQPSFPDLTPACLSRLISCCSSLKANPFLITVSTSPWILEHIVLSHTCAPLRRLSLLCAFYLASSCPSLKFQLKSSILGSLPAAATYPPPPWSEWVVHPQCCHGTCRSLCHRVATLYCHRLYPRQCVSFLGADILFYSPLHPFHK